MKEYEYIAFIELPSKPKTKVFEVRNKMFNSLLGYVKWYPHWRKYCFLVTHEEMVFDAGCLADIQDFLNKLMLERKK